MTPRNTALAIVLVFLAAGLANIDQYGETWDEAAVSLRAGLARRYVAEAWQSRAIPSRQWLHRAFEGSGVDWYHPVMFATAVRAVAAAATAAGVAPVPAEHLLTLVVSTAGLWFVFLFGRRLVGDRAAAVATLLMALYPPFIAHAHYNPKDVPVMALMNMALYCLCRARETGRGDVLAALACALTVTTKLDGLALFPIFGTALAAAGNRPDQAALLRTARFFGWFGLFTLLMWPMLLSDPLLPLRSLGHFASDFQEDARELYLGHSESHGDHPWHFAPLWLLLATPLPVVVLALAGVVITGRRLGLRPDRFAVALLLAWLLIPVVPRALRLVIVYNGMRHLFLAIPAMMLLAGAGFEWLAGRFGRRGFVTMAAALAVYLVVEIGRLHPYEGSYVNEAGRIALGPELQESFQLDYWSAAYLQGMTWLNDHAGRLRTAAASPRLKSRVCAVTTPHIAALYAGPLLDVSCEGDADYYLVGAGLKDRCSTDPAFCATIARETRRVFEIRRMDSTLLFIAERK